MLIQKQLNGDVWLTNGGSILAGFTESVTLNLSYKRAGVEVVDVNGKQGFIELNRVAETQVLPAAAVPFTGGIVQLWDLLNTLFNNLNVSTYPSELPSLGNWVFIRSVSDFPAAVAGVITLAADTTYIIAGHFDLLGDRLVGGANTTILGGSSESSSLTSTGLTVSVALFTSEWTTPIRHIAFANVDTGVKIDGNINPPVALDWTGVNFVNIPNSCTINTCSNFIFSKGAFLNSAGLNFTGTIGTIGIDNSIFVGTGAVENLIDINALAVITRRFRVIYSAFVAFASTTAINANVGATIPVEGYILDTVNFSGGGTYQAGINYLDNRALFTSCIGIQNTAIILNYFMTNNVTATVITAINTPVKVAGTTTATALTQKFTHSNNRGTYTGALSVDLQINAVLTFTAGSNNQVGFFIAKNGAVIANSVMYATANSGGRAESITVQTIAIAATTDYFEIWAENITSTSNITVEYMNVIIKKI